MNTLRYRTEDIAPEEVLSLFVPTDIDRQIVDMIKSTSPTVIEGSRGVGKSFLLRVAEAELLRDFESLRSLPVYVTFAQSSLIHTSDSEQFTHWILAKTANRLLRAARRLIDTDTSALQSLEPLGANRDSIGPESFLERIVSQYEESYRNPGTSVQTAQVPSTETFQDCIEDFCMRTGLKRVVFLFDEVAHVFRPESQREFFTLFRDLRSPFITCNAAVYPGITSFGPSFQPAHDATFVAINRDTQRNTYISDMRDIVERQAPSDVQAAISKSIDNFSVLAYAVSGNPRLLLKTVERAGRMTSSEVNSVIKDFYRTEIWAEHSALGTKYTGHRAIVDWGRKFVEDIVLPETKRKNDQWRSEGKKESTCSLWIHRDAPEEVRSAMRLLAYTGIVDDDVDHIRSTRADVGTRYSLNLGCLFSLEANPSATGLTIANSLTKRRFTEFGQNHRSYDELKHVLSTSSEPTLLVDLQKQLARSVEVLDLTVWQIDKLKALGLTSVGAVLQSTESSLQRAWYVGPVRARQMMNGAKASVLEYLSG